jgi:hypothetical protein
MIHTDEDDEFARIERENSMKGQPYNWETNAIDSAIRIEREACAELCDQIGLSHAAELIRFRGKK